MHPNVAAVTAAARAAGLNIDAHQFPDGTRTAADAAAAIGVDVAQIVKSLVFSVDGTPVIALVSGANQLDPALLAEAAGGTAAKRADADAVRAATGFPIGGVPPFGHSTALAVFVDEDLLAFDVVWAAAGTPEHVFPAPPAELVRITGGRTVALAAR